MLPVLRQRRDWQLLGGASIDFDPLAMAGQLWGRLPRVWMAQRRCSTSTDAARRRTGQVLLFDGPQKIAVLAAQVAATNRIGNQLWLTEWNWPLQGEGRYSPTSELECVAPDQAAEFATRYLDQAWQQGHC